MNRRECLRALQASGLVASLRPAGAVGQSLKIGLTPVILADQAAFLSRWGRYLSGHVGGEVSFVSRESYQVILDMLFSGQIDAAWICGYPFVRFESDLSILAVPLYLGQPSYQAYLIGSKRGNPRIKGWADLHHKVLAYSDPLSNSGWLVAQAQLAKVGLNSKDLRRTFFAHGHRNVAEAVASGLAQAGSIDGYVWETMRQQGMKAVTQTEVVWKSEGYGFPPLVTKRGSTHPGQVLLQKALKNMSKDKVGAELLRDLNLTGFTEGSSTMFDSIRRQALAVPGSGVVA